MDEIMAQLKSLLETELRDRIGYITAVQVLDAISQETMSKVQHYPVIVITPKRGSHPRGPFTDTSRQVYEITLMVVARSVNIEAYQLPPNSGTPQNVTIYVIEKEIKKVLYANKHLIDEIFELRSIFAVGQIQAGANSALNITIEYTELERDDGMQNSQDSLSPALTF